MGHSRRQNLMLRLIPTQAIARSTSSWIAMSVRKSGASCVKQKKAGHNSAFCRLSHKKDVEDGLFLEFEMVHVFPQREHLAEVVEFGNIKIGNLRAFLVVSKRYNRL